MTNNKNTSNNNNDDAESQIPKTCVSEDEQSKNGNRRKTFAGHIRSPRRTMIYVLLTWLILTIVLSVIAFQKSLDVPQQLIDERFQELALQVQTTIQSNARNKLHPLTSWSQRLSRIQNWPFVTINEFSGQATSIHGASQVSFHPLVVWKDQALWERYSMEHVHEWMVESSSFNTNDTTGAFSSKYNNNSISPFINHGLYQPVRATSPSRPTPYYVPYWQIYPIVESLINFDALVFDFGWAAFKGVLQQNANSSSVAAVWSAPVNLKPFRDGVPKSVVAVPIFNNNHNKLVGVFLAMMSWESLLENIQPPGRLEIVVTSPNCQEIIPSMTYAISTSKEEESSKIVFMELDEDTKREGGSVLSVEDDDIVWETACPPTITLYPTEELVSAFQTSDHAKAMVWIVVAGCVLTALLFGGYIVWKRGGKHQQQPPRTTTTPYLFVDRFTEDREQHPSQKSQQQQQHSDESQPFELVSVAPSLPQGDDLSFDLHNIDDSQNAIQPTDDYEFNASEPSIQLFHPSSSFDDDLIKKQVSLVRITARRTSSPPPTPLLPQETITTTNYTSKATPSSCHILQPSEDGVWKPSIFHSPLDSSITLSSLQPQRNSDPTSRINPKSSMKRQNAPGLPRKVVSIQPPSSKPMTIYDISNHSIDLTQQKLEKEKENEKNPLFKVVPDDKPIANLYPSCTVLFADLVGFTSWSAHHSPTEVFQLLETLYGSFDRIAKRRGVFKVETIGDCYVAVTGVPLVKPDHAVAMARFCRDCMIAMRQAVEKLSETLGTAELGMRFGLHSGPVTGGVLRGLKSRFQLFGDTIAKASKIESLGQKDKIHVSQKSALLMIQAGKKHWLQEREKPIEVLGEMMQTYWLSFDPARLNVSSDYINYENDEDKNNDNSLDEYGLHDSDLDDEIIDELSKEFGMPRETGLANLYPDCTLFFAEVDGFVDWSASKEPEQVLWLLEGIYKAFDKIAKRRSIFKVETIADCYVAAAGLPMERSDHAVAMARFARECMLAVDPVLQSLKQKVGGDVVNLGMRFGLHSGPVTAGVLRGEKSRFQLFGDTVNTTSRIETRGLKGMIHVSETTALLLLDAGKQSWLTQRQDMVEAKGKGQLQTFWLQHSTLTSSKPSNAQTYNASFGHLSMSAGSSTTDDDAFSLGSSADSCEDDENEKVFQLIDDSVDLLERILKKVVAKRDGARDISVDKRPEYQRDSNVETLLDEVKDVVTLSNGDRCVYKTSPAYVRLEEKVVNQLRDFVSVIAYMYPDNKFHSFEHANYATAAMHKLFSRTVIPEKMDFVGMSEEDKIASTNLLQFSHKVASDPMTQFTLVFSALIHDVQHPGVSNEQLSKENADVAILYNKRCVNEQNSLEVAWAMFLDPSYADLRACLFKTQEELNRFRHLVVNAVMATDLFDKRLKVERYNRWTKTFVPNENSASSFQFSFSSLDAKDDADLKATVVLEYMIQASDIFHTLQPVDEFLFWNEKLFHESYQAYLDGRADLEPSRGWCAAELEFFDNYVLPLASKLKECEMFGYTAEVFMRNAARNRKEWLLRGQEHVSKFIRSYYRKPLVQ